MKDLLRRAGLIAVKFVGSHIRDEEDGALLGKALVLAFRGQVHLIGYDGPPLRPVFVAQKRIKYWRIAIGFRRAEIPDYPNVLGAQP